MGILIRSADSGPNTPFTSRYALEILYPKAIAAAPNGLDSNNIAFFAYTGLTYTRRCGAIGGSYPYICTDSASTVASETITITVGTSGWFFVDAVNGSNSNSGTAASPWQTLSKVYDSSTANSRVYFRAGTYTPAGITVTNADDINGEERIDWSSGARSTNWLAYPGDARPVIDFGYAGTGYPYNTGDSVPRFRMSGAAIAMIGLEFDNAMTMALQMSRTSKRGVYVWNNVFDGVGPGVNGGNSAHIMWIQLYGSGGVADTSAYGDVVIGNTFTDIKTGSGNSGVKLYSHSKPLIEDNDFTNTNGAGENEALALKGVVLDFTVRGNRFSSIVDIAIGGNLAGTPNDPDNGVNVTGEDCDGDIVFNYVADAGVAGIEIGANRVRPIGRIDIKRNTVVAPFIFDTVVTADGPYNVGKNAVENADSGTAPWPHFTDVNVSDTDRVVMDDNEVGTNVVDGSGNLIDTAKIGTHGHVIP
jgi:hypothetical protein